MLRADAVREFEVAFAEYVGAKYAIALCNGTATLHTALVANEVRRVVVPPLTMSATTIAALHAGVEVTFGDVDPQTWTLVPNLDACNLPVSLYGLGVPWCGSADIDDAAQTLRQHSRAAFTSYSFQASKILPLGEGGMLATNHEHLAVAAREFSSLGYRMRADQPRIDTRAIRDPRFDRHHSLGWNYRMSPLLAQRALAHNNDTGPSFAAWCRTFTGQRRTAASCYRDAIAGCSWITPQYVPNGWQHDYWCYAVALESPDLWHPFVNAIVEHRGERPYAAWKLTYQEPAFRHLAPDGTCPVAESLQPRLVQFQTNNLSSARRNAEAVSKAIQQVGGHR